MTPSVPARLTAAFATGLTIVWISWDHLQPAWRWTVPAVAAVCVALAWAVPAAQSSLPAGGLPILLLGVAAASYACVPETDPIVRLAVVPATAAVVELVRRRPVSFVAAWASAALVLWAGVHGSSGRHSALVGALVAWWTVMLAAVLGRSSLRPTRRWAWSVAMAPAFAATVIVARTGALEPTVRPALRDAATWCLASLGVTLVVAALLRTIRPSRIVQRAG